MRDISVEIRGSWLAGKQTAFLEALHGAVVQALEAPADEPLARLPSQELLRDLTLELDAVGSVFHHGSHPPTARHHGQFGSAYLSTSKGPLQNSPHRVSRRGIDDHLPPVEVLREASADDADWTNVTKARLYHYARPRLRPKERRTRMFLRPVLGYDAEGAS